MITKAIVEQIVDPYQIRIRIPKLDRMPQSSQHTKTSDLNIALVCTLPGCDPNIQIGDIVYVALDEKNEDEAIILGYLYRSKMTSTQCNMLFKDLAVSIRATLPDATTIGDVTSTEIQCLSGISDNIQDQLNSISQRVALLEKAVQHYFVTVTHTYMHQGAVENTVEETIVAKFYNQQITVAEQLENNEYTYTRITSDDELTIIVKDVENTINIIYER